MRTYLELLERVLKEGERRTDRTGVGTLSIFGAQTRYDLRQGFPLVTTKKVIFDSVVKELLWFLRGETNTKTLGCGIWDAWADKDGELGPIYGKQWRSWSASTPTGEPRTIDQIKSVVEAIARDPTSRRLIVSAWNVGDLPQMALSPCHALFQFYVAGDRLDLQLYQRSADLAVGVPFNIASYALLLHIVAAATGLSPGYFIHTFGDAHIYLNHVDGVREQLTRTPYDLPQVRLKKRPELTPLDLTPDDLELVGYRHHPFIRFPIAV